MPLSDATTLAFSDIVALQAPKLALKLALVHSGIRSVLLSGVQGVGKSTLLEACASLFPKNQVLYLPSQLSLEMLEDETDTQALLQEGIYKKRNGLFRRMAGKIVVADNLNLMSPMAITALLQNHEQASGAASYLLLAATNPNEGALSAGNLDKFDLFCEITPATDLRSRVEVLRQHASLSTREGSDAILESEIQRAKKKIAKVQASEADFHLACQWCRDYGVLGHRADALLLKAALAYAALAGRSSLLRSDFMAVKDLVLSHRLHSVCQEQEAAQEPENTPKKRAEENETETSPQSNEAEQPPREADQQEQSPSEEHEKGESQAHSDAAASGIKEQHDEIAETALRLDPLAGLHKRLKNAEGIGTRSKCSASGKRGRYVRPEQPRNASFEIALTATIRAAAPFQARRKQAAASESKALIIREEDYRAIRKEQRSGHHILFLVDTSGSMGIRRRMRTVKGLVFELLKMAYIKRDSVAMMSFHGDEAELLLPFTRSVLRAQRELQEIKTGGRTPLYLGLRRSLEYLQTEKRKQRQIAPILVLFTDGRATSKYKGENQFATLSPLMQHLSALSVKTLVVNTEEGFIRLGKAKEIAECMKARYLHLDELLLEEENLLSHFK